MNQFNTLEVAIFLVAVLLVAVLGFIAGRLSRKNGSRKQLETLEQTLAEERARAAAYREQVGTHFGRSAELFAGMTQSYKNLYDHLAQGYTALGVAETQGEPGFKEQMLALQPDAPLTLAGAATSAAASEVPDPEHTPVITEAEAVYGESSGHETDSSADADAASTTTTTTSAGDNTASAVDETTDEAAEDSSAPADAAPADAETAATDDANAVMAEDAGAENTIANEPQHSSTAPLASADSSGRREPGLRDEVP